MPSPCPSGCGVARGQRSQPLGFGSGELSFLHELRDVENDLDDPAPIPLQGNQSLLCRVDDSISTAH
jgi:hypothetical protein